MKKNKIEKKTTPEQKHISLVGKVPPIKPGKYADGLPYREVEYLCCKLILKPNRFTSRKSLFNFGKVLSRTGEKTGVTYTSNGYKILPIKIREVLFIDTADFKLYNNAFILRRRIEYEDGFPLGDPEFVFKYRHPDIQKAAEADVRPNILGDFTVKFKCQFLPLKGELGGIRMLFSHNIQTPRSNATKNEVSSMEKLTELFPILKSIQKSPDEKIQLVNDTIIEEVLQDIGELDFGKGIRAKANVAIWRTRGEHRPLIGEFAFQIKFNDRKILNPEAMKRMEDFFIQLQYDAKDWIALDATKTGVVYRLLGNPPTSHE